MDVDDQAWQRCMKDPGKKISACKTGKRSDQHQQRHAAEKQMIESTTWKADFRRGGSARIGCACHHCPSKEERTGRDSLPLQKCLEDHRRSGDAGQRRSRRQSERCRQPGRCARRAIIPIDDRVPARSLTGKPGCLLLAAEGVLGMVVGIGWPLILAQGVVG